MHIYTMGLKIIEQLNKGHTQIWFLFQVYKYSTCTQTESRGLIASLNT